MFLDITDYKFVKPDVPYSDDNSDDDSDDDATDRFLQQVYKQPSLNIYRILLKLLCGEDGNYDACEYFLTDGCYNENYAYAYHLIIGKDAAFYFVKFYDL